LWDFPTVIILGILALRHKQAQRNVECQAAVVSMILLGFAVYR